MMISEQLTFLLKSAGKSSRVTSLQMVVMAFSFQHSEYQTGWDGAALNIVQGGLLHCKAMVFMMVPFIPHFFAIIVRVSFAREIATMPAR